MVNKRKQGLTQARAKLTSHRMRSATVGTHVPRRSSRHMNGEAVGFSSPRKRKRAARGIVETILPVTSSGESSSQYARRVSRREFAQDIQRKARIRRIVAIAVCLLVAVAVAAAVGVATFFGSLDAKLGLKDSDAASALVAPKADAKAFYTVVSADLDAPGSANATDGPDAIALVRVDEETRVVTVVSIPPTLQVSLKDGKKHPLREASTQEGDAALVSAVADFAGVNVAHYVKTDAESIVRLVDALGGVEVNVAEEVDDPNAGDAYLPAGTQTSTARAVALTFLRASNFFERPLEVQAANQREAAHRHCPLRLLGEGPAELPRHARQNVGGSFQDRTFRLRPRLFRRRWRLSRCGLIPRCVRGGLCPANENRARWRELVCGVFRCLEEHDGAQWLRPVSEPVVEQTRPGGFRAASPSPYDNGSGVDGRGGQNCQTQLKDRGLRR